MSDYETILDREGAIGLQTLLQHFPHKINEVDGRGDTPLTCAIKAKNGDLVVWLINEGADPNLCKFIKPRYQCPVGVALDYVNAEILELLLQNGANANAKCYKWKQVTRYSYNGSEKSWEIEDRIHPLFYLLNKYYGENSSKDQAKARCVEILLTHGADVGITDKYGKTLLHQIKDPPVLELLLQHGADANARNNNGETPAYVAAQQGQAQKLAILSRFGGVVDKQVPEKPIESSLSSMLRPHP